MTVLGDYIKSARLEKGYSLRECAKVCGLSHARIDVIEKGIDVHTGKTPAIKTETLMKIANGLNLDVMKLISLQMCDNGLGAIKDEQDVELMRHALNTIGESDSAKLFTDPTEVLNLINGKIPTKKAPAVKQEPFANISMEESNSLLAALGLVEDGYELSDDDLAFLTNVLGLLNNWFGRNQP